MARFGTDVNLNFIFGPLGLFLLEIAGGWFYDHLSRSRPYGVPITGSSGGYSAPSLVVTVLTFFLMGVVYSLAVPGRPRSSAKAGVAAVVALSCLSRLYQAVDHPDDALFGFVLGVAIPVTGFRFFTPNEVFGIAYRRDRTAHVDVTGRRGAAIRHAVHARLGLTALEIRSVGLEPSAGSTPLRLTVKGDPDQYLFAKLYTLGHVRAERWYKAVRTILYGVLEDEHPFHSVRQLTQCENYAPAPAAGHRGSHGGAVRMVEITLERGVPPRHRVLHRRSRDRHRGH